MGSLVVVYLLGWVAVAAFAGRLALVNSRLTERLDQCETLLRRTSTTSDDARRKAA